MKTVLVSSLSSATLHSAREHDPRAATLAVVKVGCGGSAEAFPGGKGDIGVNLSLTIPEALKGTGSVNKAIFPVFVALLDQEDNVLDRHDEKIEITITDQALSHIHTITYHLPEGIDVGSETHRLLVGFNGGVIPVRSPMVHAQPINKAAPKKVRKKRGQRKAGVKKTAKA
jgi:hypothetical protein